MSNMIPRGWTAVDLSDVPDGGDELQDMLASLGSEAADGVDAVARRLRLDPGLIRRGFQIAHDRAQPAPTSPTPSSMPKHAKVPTAKRRKSKTAGLPSVKSDEKARILLLLAAARGPLTLDRAKTITRMTGDDLEDVLDSLVVSGRLIEVEGATRLWARTR